MVNLSVAVLPTYLDPTEAWNYQEFLLIQAVYDTLVRSNENGRIVASLAKRWSVEENGKKYVFEVDPRAIFHDGMPVTAEDVAFSIARHFWPESKSEVKAHLLPIIAGSEGLRSGKLPAGIKILDKYRIAFSLVDAYPPFLSVLAMPGFSIFKKTADLHAQPIGSGPMRGKYSSVDQTWTLERFVGYLGIPPNTKTYCVFARKSLNEVFEGFQSASLDVAIGAPFGEIDQTAIPKSVKVLKTNSLVFSHLFVNPESIPLKNKNFRQDFASLIHGLLLKKATMLSSFERFTPTYIPDGVLPKGYYDRSASAIAPEVFRSKWSKMTANHALKIVLSKMFFGEAFVAELRDLFRKAGIRIDLVLLTGADLNSALEGRTYDVISMGYIGNFADPDGFLELLRAGNGFPQAFGPSVRLFSDLQKIRFANSSSVRLKEYSLRIREFEDEAYVIPLLRISLPILHTEGIHIPDTSYRFEAELKNIFWQIKERK